MGVDRFNQALEKQCEQAGICIIKHSLTKKSKFDEEAFFTDLIRIIPKDNRDRKNKKKRNGVGASVVNALACVKELRACFINGDPSSIDALLLKFIGTTLTILSPEGIVPSVKYVIRISKSDLSRKEIGLYIQLCKEEYNIDCNKDNCFDIVFAVLGTILTYSDLMVAEYEYDLGLVSTDLNDYIGSIFRLLKMDVFRMEYSGELRVVAKYKANFQ